MGLFVVAISVALIVLVVLFYRQVDAMRELRNAHVNLAAEVGTIKRNSIAAMEAHHRDIVESFNQEIKSAREGSAAGLAGLNERLVLLEIEKTAKPATPEEPPPPRRSFASQKARAEAGARKG